MKTLSLAGGWCWYPFTAVPRISRTFTLFVLLSPHFLHRPCRGKKKSHFKRCRLHLAHCLVVSTHMPNTPFFSFHLPSPSLISCAHPSASNAWSSASVQRLTVCLQPSCHHLIPPLSVYSGICCRKYILGWLISPRFVSAARWWLPAAVCGIFVWGAIFENKFCRWYKSHR